MEDGCSVSLRDASPPVTWKAGRDVVNPRCDSTYSLARTTGLQESERGHMTIIATPTTGMNFRRGLRSAAAVFLGFIAVAVLSLATDQVLHVFGVYPS